MSHPEWHSSLGKAIYLCLDVLSETGIKDKGFDMFWVQGTAAAEWIATLRPSEHMWVGFLKDSEDCCTVAFFENTCLELDNLSCVRRCQNEVSNERVTNRTYTVLKTAILLMRLAFPTQCVN